MKTEEEDNVVRNIDASFVDAELHDIEQPHTMVTIELDVDVAASSDSNTDSDSDLDLEHGPTTNEPPKKYTNIYDLIHDKYGDSLAGDDDFFTCYSPPLNIVPIKIDETEALFVERYVKKMYETEVEDDCNEHIELFRTKIANYESEKLRGSTQRTLFERCVLYTNIAFELYRATVGTFLIVFIQQRCGDHQCSPFENVAKRDPFFVFTMTWSCLTYMLFAFLYYNEITREYKLVRYFAQNKEDRRGIYGINHSSEYHAGVFGLSYHTNVNGKPNNPIANCSLAKEIKQDIYRTNLWYYCTALYTCLFFMFNVLFSAVAVGLNTAGENTAIGFITNVVIIIPKFYGIFDNFFTCTKYYGHGVLSIYSGFKREFVQYNDYSLEYSEKILESMKAFKGELFMGHFKSVVDDIQTNGYQCLAYYGEPYIDEEWEKVKRRRYMKKLMKYHAKDIVCNDVVEC
jgi:hypothetical protein